MEKAVLFNTALVLTNLNANILEPKFRQRAKLGHLGQWIEFHAKPQRRLLSATIALSPDKVFKRSFVSSGKKGGTMPNPKKRTPELNFDQDLF